MYLAFNPRRCGTMMSIDGQERWLIHNFLYNGEPDYDSVDRDWSIRNILGVGPDFEYEIISKEDWIGRRLVSDRFQNGRVFIAGDAAHLWIPHAGYGMNAGIADAADLAWMLAAVLQGWAEPALLDAYQAERQPITDQVSHFAFNMSKQISHQRREISPDIERDDEVGEATRAQIGKEAYDLYVQQQCCGGLNFGYFYAGSPIIAYDGAAHPAYSMGNVRVVVGAGLPRSALLAARRPLALRRAGRGLRPDPVRQERRGGRFGRGGKATRYAACCARHRRCGIGSALRETAGAGAARPACRMARRRRAGRCAGIDRPSAWRGRGVDAIRARHCRGASRRLGRLARVCHDRYSAAWAGGAESMKPPDWRRHSSA